MSGDDFEAEREANIARNQALLAQLGIAKNVVVVPKKKPQPRPKPVTVRKKRKESPTHDDEDEQPPVKIAALKDEGDEGGPRRSGRNAGKKVDYAGDGDNLERRGGPSIISENARRKEMGSEPKSVLERKHDPRTYGAIPGVRVGTWWETRKACSIDAIHAPWVAGISPGPDGCYSVALSGGYEDDVDVGEALYASQLFPPHYDLQRIYHSTYTGSGGRDLKGTKNNPKNLRTAPQSSDQSFNNTYNRSLQLSVETKKPVRVIRGYKLHSIYAPAEGYRYDGLYTVEKAWMEKGLNSAGHKVCKFIFKVFDLI
ncbi:hypothetical protein PHLCEN_2v406 [Hermanssonia centrifuga]|uniref:YDG domain-containing protein n=1 Tax=Hermanssonia centrifuga TaxID=98765 RepID=A0A2R6S644_9APHY|nr:hypothetical protein PHLCEN_2v406 [Hermanssonia centrifuga]